MEDIDIDALTLEPEQKEPAICGVLGGLGPEATLHFLQLIQDITKEQYGATTDQDHVHMVIEMNPMVPDRTTALLGNGKSSGPFLQKMALRLATAKTDYVVCVCNTAHAFQADIMKGCGDVPFLSLIEVTSNTVRKRITKHGGAEKCGILATNGCVSTKMYQNALLKRKIEPILPSEKSQELVMDVITRIKAGDKVSVISDFNKVIMELKEQGCSQLILGCTELPIIIDDCLKANKKLKRKEFVDTTAVLAETVVHLFKGKFELDRVLQDEEGELSLLLEAEEQSETHDDDDESTISSMISLIFISTGRSKSERLPVPSKMCFRDLEI